MQNKEMSGVRGKAVVVSAALLSLAFGNVAAKAADTPINQMFSKNVEVRAAGKHGKDRLKERTSYLTIMWKIAKAQTLGNLWNSICAIRRIQHMKLFITIQKRF